MIDCRRNVLDWPTDPVPSTAVRWHSVRAGFALIFLIKLSFTWDMAFLLAHPSFYLSLLDETAWSLSPPLPPPVLPIMECKTGDAPILTKAIIFLKCVSSLHSCHTETVAKKNTISFEYTLPYFPTSPNGKTVWRNHFPLCGGSAEVRRDK